MSVPADSPNRHEHAGTEFVFCSATCRDRFTRDPGSFLEQAPAATAAPSRVIPGGYTCPMHPEIVRDAPGSCPICGMALELRAPAANAGENAELRDMSRRFWFSVALTVPLLGLAMGDMLPGEPVSALLSARLR
ncbi:MAG: YHS domain-containing protein, partial [Thermoanaerobaculia bacterium]|nr:YHS domain-containing protein [Thermoanaerobaculia bacterium]